VGLAHGTKTGPSRVSSLDVFISRERRGCNKASAADCKLQRKVAAVSLFHLRSTKGFVWFLSPSDSFVSFFDSFGFL
jgi:hypothetical protein